MIDKKIGLVGFDSSHEYRIFTDVTEEEMAALKEACAEHDVSIAWFLHCSLRAFLFDSFVDCEASDDD